MLKIYKITPVFNQIVVTADKYSKEESLQNGLYTGKENTTKEYQKVLAVGPTVRGIEVGDMISINPSRYIKLLHKQGLKDMDRNVTKDDIHAVVDFPKETVYIKNPDGVETSKEVLILYDNDVHFVIKEGDYEEVSMLIEKPSLIIVPPRTKS